MNQHRNKITNKAYDKSELRARQKQCIVTPGDPPVEPRMTKQQTRLSPAQTSLNNATSYVGPIVESDALPASVQLQRKAKLPTVIGLISKHADRCMTSTKL